jgi:DMSO/TMAO reductase YedYZ molybdopterin-dependent catalytic subunit
MDRRRFLLSAAAGTALVALGGTFVLAAEDDPRAKALRPDGRPRLPPGQRLLSALKPMGGDPGDPSPSAFRLRVHGEVERPLDLDFAALLALPQSELTCDVHCVTGWSVLDCRWTGVRVSHLAELAKVRPASRHVIIEAANGYTANVRLAEALAPSVAIVHRYEGKALPRPHGPPARALVPDLYFWKSAKWVTGLRFVARDEPGYWERRGYHNHADPWLEERYG